MRERRLRQIFSTAFQRRSCLEYQAAWERGGGGAWAGKHRCVRKLTMTAGASMAALMPRTPLAVIDNCGHIATMEGPAVVSAAMRAWLEQTT